MNPALSELHKHLSVGSGNQIQSIEILSTCARAHTLTGNAWQDTMIIPEPTEIPWERKSCPATQ